MKICLLSSGPHDDIRVFQKMAKTLQQCGNEIFIVTFGESETVEGIRIIGVGYENCGRLMRMTRRARLIYERALQIDADLYILCHTEYLRYAVRLSKHAAVIFDSAEDYPQVIMAREYIPKFVRKPLSALYIAYEKSVCRRIDGVIACYHWTKQRLETCNRNVELIFNFPIIEGELVFDPTCAQKAHRTICYAGNIADQWCHTEILGAIEGIEDITYLLAGPIDSGYSGQLEKCPAWSKVRPLGRIPQREVLDSVYRASNVGMCLLDYIPQCKGTLGNLSNNKFFEYMSAGIPLICTDFVYWKEIIDEYKCGICVNPHDQKQIRDAIVYLLEHPGVCAEMGKNGIMAINKKYNWALQKDDLLRVIDRAIEK